MTPDCRYYRRYPWKRQQNNGIYEPDNYLCTPTRDDVFQLLIALHEARSGNMEKTVSFCNRRRPARAILTSMRFIGKRWTCQPANPFLYLLHPLIIPMLLKYTVDFIPMRTRENYSISQRIALFRHFLWNPTWIKHEQKMFYNNFCNKILAICFIHSSEWILETFPLIVSFIPEQSNDGGVVHWTDISYEYMNITAFPNNFDNLTLL